jgi:hypothetical protein
MLLDTFTSERFARTLGAKLGMAPASPLELEELRVGTVFELYEREVSRDSRRYLSPQQPIDEPDLRWVGPLLKISFLLRQIRPNSLKAVLGSMEPSLARILRQRLEQRWQFSQEARHNLCQAAKFDADLFECFAQRAPSGVAEWLLDQLFFGVNQVGRLCELSPLTIRPARPGKGPKLRGSAPAQMVSTTHGHDGALTKGMRLAIVLMSLPPEVSAQLFKNMGPELVHAITLEISKLPPISPELSQQVISEVTGLVPDELEAAAREQADPMAEFLKRYYCGEED